MADCYHLTAVRAQMVGRRSPARDRDLPLLLEGINRGLRR